MRNLGPERHKNLQCLKHLQVVIVFYLHTQGDGQHRLEGPEGCFARV